MKLFRVSGLTDSTYVLAASFDAAFSVMGGADSTHYVIQDLGEPLQWVAPVVQTASEPVEPRQPAVPIKKSITPDYLICLDDGLKFKSLKRHLSLLGMTPETYRAKWKLAPDYPMVAPAYSAQRSEMAKSFGLGRK